MATAVQKPTIQKRKPTKMGAVIVSARIENMTDVVVARRKLIPPSEIRAVEVVDALVDTGTHYLCLPKPLIKQLGLERYGKRRVRTANGNREAGMYGPVNLIVQERYCTIDVMDLPEGAPVLIGQIPLEMLDFVVDPPGQRLIGNPAHGGQWMADMF